MISRSSDRPCRGRLSAKILEISSIAWISLRDRTRPSAIDPMIRISTGLCAGSSRRAASLRSHQEPPWFGAARDVREELRVDLQVGRLLCRRACWADAIEMIFDGGTADENDLAYWSLQSTEIKAVALVDLATASEF